MLEGKVPHRQYLIDDQDYGFQVCRNRKRQPNVHAAGVVLHRSIDKLVHFSEGYDLVNPASLLQANLMGVVTSDGGIDLDRDSQVLIAHAIHRSVESAGNVAERIVSGRVRSIQIGRQSNPQKLVWALRPHSPGVAVGTVHGCEIADVHWVLEGLGLHLGKVRRAFFLIKQRMA